MVSIIGCLHDLIKKVLIVTLRSSNPNYKGSRQSNYEEYPLFDIIVQFFSSLGVKEGIFLTIYLYIIMHEI